MVMVRKLGMNLVNELGIFLFMVYLMVLIVRDKIDFYCGLFLKFLNKCKEKVSLK